MTTTETSAALHELVAATAVEHHCPTVSWAVTIDGHLVDSGGHGTLHDRRSPTADTVYRIASMTKSFTAATVLALRDEDVLSLDDHIADLAPELSAIAGPTSDAAPITVRHLLSMASGLANDDAWADRHLDITAADLDDVFGAGALFAAPTGTAFEYSNLGFAMLGRIVARVSGRRVQEHVGERFLGPLGMSRTTWVRPTHDDWARPFQAIDGVAVADPVEPLGDGEIAVMGGLWSTVADVCRWMTWLDDATPARDEVESGPLSRSSRREMQQIQRYGGMKVLAGRAAPTGYGFGLMVRDDDRLGRAVGHSGGLPGYGSNMRWLAGRRVGVVALGNVMYAPMSELTQRLLEELHDHDALPSPPAAAPGLLDDLARRLVCLLGAWTDAAADELFTDNVALDEPYHRRADAASELAARLGVLEIESVAASSATSGTIELRGPVGIVTPPATAPAATPTPAATVWFDLATARPPRIQSYGIEPLAVPVVSS